MLKEQWHDVDDIFLNLIFVRLVARFQLRYLPLSPQTKQHGFLSSQLTHTLKLKTLAFHTRGEKEGKGWRRGGGEIGGGEEGGEEGGEDPVT